MRVKLKIVPTTPKKPIRSAYLKKFRFLRVYPAEKMIGGSTWEREIDI
jgi:hypothetical protein